MLKIMHSREDVEHENKNENNGIVMEKHKYEMLLSMEDIISTPISETYILGLSGIDTEPEFRFCAALSDYSCVVYNVGEALCKLTTLKDFESSIVGTKFSHSSKHILYIGTENNSISICDLRAKGKVVSELKDNSSDGKLKPLCSFDVNCDDKLVTAGTEHIGGDAFILFWDVRFNHSKLDNKNNLLGGYWESHMDDITSLSFHPNQSNLLASGSTDGLINIYDLTQRCEDSALSYSLNTESSVDRLGWLGEENIWCTTHTHCLQLWNCEDASPYTKYNRSCVANVLNEDTDNCYLVNMHKTNTANQAFLLSGSSTVKGENLSGLTITPDGMEVSYFFSGNKQLVRDSWRHAKNGYLVTGGEGGSVNLWKQSELSNNRHINRETTKSNGKIRDRHLRSKPY